MHEEDRYREAAHASGADGFALKRAVATDLISAIRQLDTASLGLHRTPFLGFFLDSIGVFPNSLAPIDQRYCGLLPWCYRLPPQQG